MVTVASKELKNRLGKYLHLVKEGHTVQVTDRGKAVACILPVGTPEKQDTARLLSALAAKGSVTLGSGRLSRTHRPTRLAPGKSLVEMISEDRR